MGRPLSMSEKRECSVMTKPAKSAPADPSAKFNLAKMRAARFTGFSRAHLNKAAEMLNGITPDASDSDDEVTAALCAACNMPAPREGGEQKPPGEREVAERVASGVAMLPQPKVGHLGRIPNLSSTGRWEGRRRRVQFALADNPEGTITLGWDANQKWTIQTPDIIDMPWPYWQRVVTAIHVDDKSNKARRFKHDDDGKLYVITKPKKKALYQFVDLGDVPGTENLPLSYWDFFRKEGLKNFCFRGFGRSALVMIYNKLTDVQSSKFYDGKDNAVLRRLIAEILDPSLTQLMDEEAYEQEAAPAKA